VRPATFFVRSTVAPAATPPNTIDDATATPDSIRIKPIAFITAAPREFS
jgi:hypothetical protein